MESTLDVHLKITQHWKSRKIIDSPNTCMTLFRFQPLVVDDPGEAAMESAALMPIIGKMVGAPWDGTPLIINPIYTVYSRYLLGPNPLFKGYLEG